MKRIKPHLNPRDVREILGEPIPEKEVDRIARKLGIIRHATSIKTSVNDCGKTGNK